MTCEEFEELSGAYALDAITPAEREAAQAHLAGCAACTRRLQELRAVVDVLPYSAPQVNPPASLKGRVLGAIRTENTRTQPLSINRNAPPRPKRWWITPSLAVAAALMLLLLGGMAAWNVSLQHQISSLQQQNTSLQHQLALAYGLNGQGATGKLIYLPEQNITVLVINGLPELRGTQVYQGWLIHGKQPISIGLLSEQNGVASVIYPGTIAGYQIAAVSREPGPKASKNVPAGPVVATGALKEPVVL
jgi:anti-sigma-K factor RskA